MLYDMIQNVGLLRNNIFIDEHNWNDNSRNDERKNEVICSKLRVAPIKENMRQDHLRCFGHEQRRLINTPIRKNDSIPVMGEKKVRRHRIIWIETMKNYILIREVTKSIILDMLKWRKKNTCSQSRLADRSITNINLIEIKLNWIESNYTSLKYFLVAIVITLL